MWYEEFNWAIMFILNTGINLYFFVSGDMQSSNDPRWMCVYISLVFGAVYLPFQICGHLPAIDSAERRLKREKIKLDLSLKQVRKGCLRITNYRNKTRDFKAWGGMVGAIWMIGYWILEPFWLLIIAESYGKSPYRY